MTTSGFRGVFVCVIWTINHLQAHFSWSSRLSEAGQLSQNRHLSLRCGITTRTLGVKEVRDHGLLYKIDSILQWKQKRVIQEPWERNKVRRNLYKYLSISPPEAHQFFLPSKVWWITFNHLHCCILNFSTPAALVWVERSIWTRPGHHEELLHGHTHFLLCYHFGKGLDDKLKENI